MTNNASNVNSFAMIISMNAQLREEIGSRKLIGFLNITLPLFENMNYVSVTAIGPTIVGPNRPS